MVLGITVFQGITALHAGPEDQVLVEDFGDWEPRLERSDRWCFALCQQGGALIRQGPPNTAAYFQVPNRF